ncbi:MAG TPA: DNA replication/repair protein RecF [Chloroflexia bacterium]|nr:DNA replication/repair protein RecF [Chloroflexia bacterium]
MYCAHLRLDEFRNYGRLDCDLPAGISVIQGANGSGKTSLLEALYLLATTRSPRASYDAELVNTLAAADLGVPPFARIAAQVIRRDEPVALELIIAREDSRALTLPAGTAPELAGAAPPPPIARKRIKINNVARRAMDLIGQVNVVLFTPEDVDLVIGEPALRRRYLDMTISQVDHRYVRTLSHYQKVLVSRNALLRQMREQGRNPLAAGVADELRYWDDELARAGAYLVLRRQVWATRINRLAGEIHTRLVGATVAGADVRPFKGHLQVAYASAVAPETRSALAPDLAAQWSAVHAEAATASDGDHPHAARLHARIPHVEAVVTQLAGEITAQLDKSRVDEVRRGVSLLGPHRDDLRLSVAELPLATFGSRGQQRTAVLALKLAEVALMRAETGEPPILLLDDILSELDARRRGFLLAALAQPIDPADRPPQVLITTTDWAPFTPAFLVGVSRFEVDEGDLRSL